MKEQIFLAMQETEAIIEDLLADGSDPDALYLIEHHISSDNFDTLEKVAVEAFKLGYEATDPEEDVDENGNPIISFDILSEIPLDGDLINSQIAQIIELTTKFSVSYDGWGTYFEDGEDEGVEDSEPDSNQTLH
ncbi:ribonuclease E inhibitor RraB [Orbaceae bacterium ESL0721]|nr:ribonuclease E inhibitor RraB [Orbaceae bacterium ESL0721]MDF7670888.1 ribonuclease E inhibitor RraB [Orbaceae bacterium ESL0721]MDF7671558.1 ribonuclease E inhibitor RraB [Orbaceae bacterium ESL0721]